MVLSPHWHCRAARCQWAVPVWAGDCAAPRHSAHGGSSPRHEARQACQCQWASAVTPRHGSLTGRPLCAATLVSCGRRPGTSLPLKQLTLTRPRSATLVSELDARAYYAPVLFHREAASAWSSCRGPPGSPPDVLASNLKKRDTKRASEPMSFSSTKKNFPGIEECQKMLGVNSSSLEGG